MAQRKKASSASSPGKSPRAPSKKAPARPPRPPEEPLAESSTTLPFEIDPKRIEESIEALKVQVLRWAKKGRYTKVRIKFRGKQVVPDLPLAAVAAFEGATFYWGGLLRALVFNLAGRAVQVLLVAVLCVEQLHQHPLRQTAVQVEQHRVAP